jgi:predicted short-subunit dehydrogenase-like oxidoreductase (DUF2520 family)
VGRDDALGAAVSLAEGTLANVRAAGLPGALTGPVERGDEGSVRRHVEALGRELPALSDAYAALGRTAAELALAKGSIDRAAAARLEGALGR